MKIPLRNCVGKMFTIEEGRGDNPNQELKRVENHFRYFKWFITINILILLIFCGYALWNFYQLESAMRSREGDTNLENLNPYQNSSRGNIKVGENDTVVISDFNDWRKSILKGLDDVQANKTNASSNLKFLLNTITNAVKSTDGSKSQTTTSSPTLTNKLVITNLTDIEIQILKEFTKLKMVEPPSRVPRTVKGDKDKSACDLRFSIYSDYNDKVRVLIDPTKDFKQPVTVNDTDFESIEDDKPMRECTFSVVYESSEEE